ncbi:MAG: tetratricopeptide repeat protein [candidate division WOR-3 bacterium]|nr:MAG: tetratricopeptide repeat protein [candidate division WOR-3 bacterium]
MKILKKPSFVALLASKLFYTCVVIIILSSCAYFNTVYNAKNYFREGRKSVRHDTLVTDSENFDKTIEKSTAIIVKYPDTRWIDDALFMMGASYYFKGDYARSLEKLDFLIQNYPESGYQYESQYLIGLANYKLERYGSAVVALREAMNARKFRKKSLIALLYVYYGDANYKDLYEIADTLMNGSLSYDERRTVLRFVSMAQFEEQRYEDALETSSQLLSITRDERERRDLKLRIAEIYLEIGEFDLCRKFLVDETDPEFRDLLADLYLKTGNVAEAKDICSELSQNRMPDVAAEAFYEIAQIYESEDSIDLAVANYDSALVKSPNSEYGLKARKRSEVLKRIQSLTGETEDEVRSQFLLAEIYFADINDLPKALEGYQNVYRNYPKSKWAPKALYAHLWIASYIHGDDTLAATLARSLIDSYPRTEYAMSAQQILQTIESDSSVNGQEP